MRIEAAGREADLVCILASANELLAQGDFGIVPALDFFNFMDDVMLPIIARLPKKARAAIARGEPS